MQVVDFVDPPCEFRFLVARFIVSDFTFAQVPVADIQRSSFNRSYGYKTTFDSGYLIPFFMDEALPGDTFNVKASLFARLATQIVPIMDNLYMDVFFFAVPNRLLWSNWQKFMGEQLNPGDSTDFRIPTVTPPTVGWVQGTVGDYFGLPIGVVNAGAGFPIPAALHFRAYNLIWNEWFRDENLQTRATQNVGDGPDAQADYPLRRRGKRHDYFTSCLPWPQKGPGVMLPLGTSAPVVGVNPNSYLYVHGATSRVETNLQIAAGGVGSNVQNSTGGMTATEKLQWGSAASGANVGLMVDLTNATAATINSLRQAFQIQKLLERDARGGTRYVELLRSHFGVVSPDARLQRPEFLGGGSVAIVVNPVAQTSSTDAVTPLAALAGFGVVSARGIGFVKSFVEHCTLLGLLMVRADISYQQGVNRMWNRRTRYDYYWPAFAHLGEQAVLNKEIYVDGTSTDDDVFGYQERWAEYKYGQSLITGKLRSTWSTPLDKWHLAQKFTTRPTLGDTFISENPPVSRIIAVPSEPQFILDGHINIRAARPMPTYSVPGLMDHF